MTVYTDQTMQTSLKTLSGVNREVIAAVTTEMDEEQLNKWIIRLASYVFARVQSAPPGLLSSYIISKRDIFYSINVYVFLSLHGCCDNNH